MITDLSNQTQASSTSVTGQMRSWRGFFGSLVLLLMLPLAVLYQLLFTSGSDTFVHWLLAIGSVLMALAVFDFHKTLPWTQWIGSLGALTLAVIFFLQGASHLIQNTAFTYLVYNILGQAPEAWSFRLFLYGWGVAVLLLDSQGKIRGFGIIAVLLCLAMEIYRFSITYWGAPPIAGLRAVYLVPFVWLLLESAKKNPGNES